MRVLFVSTLFPSDLRTYVHGGFKRMRLFVDALKEIAHLDMLFYVRPDRDLSPCAVAKLERSLVDHWEADLSLTLCPKFEPVEPSSKWQLYGAGAVNFFRQNGYDTTSGALQVQAFERSLTRAPDIVFAEKLPAMCPLLLTKKPLPPVFCDLDDIEHVVAMRGVDPRWSWRSKLVSYARVPALCWAERRAICVARRSFVCSESDRTHLGRFAPLSRLATIPNAVEIGELLPVTRRPTLLFLGSYWYRPNIDAAEFLIHKVWPKVRHSIPDARLIIAGTDPETIRGYHDEIPGVEFPGFIDDLDALYRRARVVCAPILSGGGTRLKIIEAAAHGKPVVATQIGAEGLEMRDGRELLLRDDPASFAQACVQLLQDTSLCERLGRAAHETASRKYDRANIIHLIQKHVQ